MLRNEVCFFFRKKMAHKDYFPIRTNNIVSCNTCAKRVPIKRMEQVRKGDHVIVNDSNCIVVEIHSSDSWCIKVTAIHSFPNDEESELKREKIDILLCRSPFVVSYACPMFKRSEIVRRAEERLASNANGNKEFATWCVTNRCFSVPVLETRINYQFRYPLFLQTMHDDKISLCDSCYEGFLQKCLPVGCIDRRPNAINKGDIVSYFYYWVWHDAVVMEVKANNKLVLAHCGMESVFYPMRIMKETVKFEDSKTLKVYVYDEWKVYSPEEVVERAQSMIGEKRSYFAFNMISKSAEFAKWCKAKMVEF